MPKGAENRTAAHQREDRGGEDGDYRVPHHVLLSGNLDDSSNCEVGMVTLQSGKVLGGMASQGLYEVTLREEFARMTRQPDADLWSASKGSGQEHLGQPGGDRGVGI